MLKANRDAQARAIKLCGGGSPSMRRHREDGGAADSGAGVSSGDAGSSGMTDYSQAIASPAPPPPPAVVKKDDKDEPTGLAGGIKPIGSTGTGPKPLNSDALRKRGGRAGSRSRR